MDYLWSPWRYQYVSRHESEQGCVFCIKTQQRNDAENFVLYRGVSSFVLLNFYPYSSGHMMIAPYQHIGDISSADEATWFEMMTLTRQAEQALRKTYRPDGINLGMNLGKSAGAGIADHIHMHVLPRWYGDSNFMTTIGDTRVLPEALMDTYRKLKPLF